MREIYCKRIWIRFLYSIDKHPPQLFLVHSGFYLEQKSFLYSSDMNVINFCSEVNLQPEFKLLRPFKTQKSQIMSRFKRNSVSSPSNNGYFLSLRNRIMPKLEVAIY